MRGYVKLLRGVNLCGIADYVSFVHIWNVIIFYINKFSKKNNETHGKMLHLYDDEDDETHKPDISLD